MNQWVYNDIRRWLFPDGASLEDLQTHFDIRETIIRKPFESYTTIVECQNKG